MDSCSFRVLKVSGEHRGSPGPPSSPTSSLPGGRSHCSASQSMKPVSDKDPKPRVRWLRDCYSAVGNFHRTESSCQLGSRACHLPDFPFPEQEDEQQHVTLLPLSSPGNVGSRCTCSFLRHLLWPSPV